MRIIAQILGTLAVVVGLGLCFLAYGQTTILNQQGINPSAVQVTQVYSQASFYGTMAIAAFLFAAVVSLGAIASQLSELNSATDAAAESAEEFYRKSAK